MRKGFPIYEEMRKFLPYMRRPLVIYDFAPDPSECPYIFEEISFSFLSVRQPLLCVAKKIPTTAKTRNPFSLILFPRSQQSLTL
jgi:hypothetical protein